MAVSFLLAGPNGLAVILPLLDVASSLRAQILKKFKILKISSSSEPPTKPHIFVGNSGGQDENFKIWALRVPFFFRNFCKLIPLPVFLL